MLKEDDLGGIRGRGDGEGEGLGGGWGGMWSCGKEGGVVYFMGVAGGGNYY